MYGDFTLFVKEKWKQFWCIHDYHYDRIGSEICRTILLQCSVCKRIK